MEENVLITFWILVKVSLIRWEQKLRWIGGDNLSENMNIEWIKYYINKYTFFHDQEKKAAKNIFFLTTNKT